MWRGRCRAAWASPELADRTRALPGLRGAAGLARRCRTAWASPLNLQPQKKHNIWKKPLCTWYSGFFHCEKLGFRAGGSTEWRISGVGFRWCAAPRLRTWCKDSRKTLFLRFLCTKSLALFGAPTPWAWCKDSRKTLFLRFLCTKSLVFFGASTLRTWCKDSRKTLFLRFSCTKSPAQDEPPPLLTW